MSRKSIRDSVAIVLEGLPISVDPIKTSVLPPVTCVAKFVLLSRTLFCKNAVLTTPPAPYILKSPNSLLQKYLVDYSSFVGVDNFPPLEGFALGSPVIAADVPIAREQLATAAILVHPANELEIAQALRSLFHDQVKRESLIQRRKGGARQFTGDGFAKVVFALLGEFRAIWRCWPASQQFPSA
jgi:glycosyltransferase involved in cell wall biosynthesis